MYLSCPALSIWLFIWTATSILSHVQALVTVDPVSCNAQMSKYLRKLDTFPNEIKGDEKNLGFNVLMAAKDQALQMMENAKKIVQDGTRITDDGQTSLKQALQGPIDLAIMGHQRWGDSDDSDSDDSDKYNLQDAVKTIRGCRPSLLGGSDIVFLDMS